MSAGRVLRAFHLTMFTLLCLVGQAVSAHAQERPPGDTGYAHYWPGACLEAIERSDEYYWRGRIDTIRYSVARDTMLSPSVLVAKECAATFTLDSVAPRNLILLARLYLAIGNDSAANLAVQRRMESVASSDDSTRSATLRDVIVAYLMAKPSRVAESVPFMEQLDGMSGNDAARAQIVAHDQMMRYATKMLDGGGIEVSASAIIQAGKRLERADRIEQSPTIFSAYAALFQMAADYGTPERPKMVIAQAREDLASLGVLDRAIQLYDSVASFLGTRAARVQATYWLGAVGDTIHPKPGKISLIVMGPSRYTIPAIRRLAHVVPDTVDVTFVYTAYGYFRNKGPLTPVEEVEAARKYIIGELSAPGSIAVSVPRFTVLPDNRKIPIRTRNDFMYGSGVGVSILLVDREGIIRRVYSRWDPWTELRIESSILAMH